LNKQTKAKFFPTNNLEPTPQPMTAAPAATGNRFAKFWRRTFSQYQKYTGL
jgi:hypothetical protein